MKDLRIAVAKSLLKVLAVSPIRGFLPPSVVVTGEDFHLTAEVLYNGLQAKEFLISSPTRLVVRIPESQVGRPLNALQVLANVRRTGKDAAVSLEITRPVGMVEGLDRLVQQWMMIFYSNPGSDIFEPGSGGGARSIIGRTTDGAGKGVAADLTLAIERTTAELSRMQSNTGIPPSERLLSATLDGVQFDEGSTVLSAQVTIQNMLGESSQVNIR